MKITTARRIAQIFFFALFTWLCVAASVGTAWWQWSGWPVAWFLELDPLVALGTAASTHALVPALGWALATIALTVLFGRVFCGFVCPFGAIHQFVGWLDRRLRKARDKIADNRHRPAQRFKYYILAVMLAAAAGNAWAHAAAAAGAWPWVAGSVLVVAVAAAGWWLWRKAASDRRAALVPGLGVAAAAAGLAWGASSEHGFVNTMQTGLLDPIPLLQRTFNLVLLPAADLAGGRLFAAGRLHTGAAVIGALFLGFVLLNLVVPRFYCRFLCPLGALLGVLGRWAPWGIGKTGARCTECSLCDVDCEGACNPMGPIRVAECLMCMNCLDTCPTAQPIGWRPRPSAGGEISGVGMSRRGFVASVAAGLAAGPLACLEGGRGPAWQAGLVRPPGSVAEDEFLARCIKCAVCMRVCPTNVLQPAGFAFGWEPLWTPALDNRIGSSGCQLTCVACGHACPTGAIRPLSLDEKRGSGAFAAAGPVRIGLAFVDHGRCLPWAMETPCIVCEENCPVTPKAIHAVVVFQTIRGGVLTVAGSGAGRLRLAGGAPLEPDRFATGDYHLLAEGAGHARRIVANGSDWVSLDPADPGPRLPAEGARVELQVRLQRPVVDPALCIGCGVCEHECPVTGVRAIRVTADNETRDPARSVLLRTHRGSDAP